MLFSERAILLTLCLGMYVGVATQQVVNSGAACAIEAKPLPSISEATPVPGAGVSLLQYASVLGRTSVLTSQKSAADPSVEVLKAKAAAAEAKVHAAAAASEAARAEKAVDAAIAQAETTEAAEVADAVDAENDPKEEALNGKMEKKQKKEEKTLKRKTKNNEKKAENALERKTKKKQKKELKEWGKETNKEESPGAEPPEEIETPLKGTHMPTSPPQPQDKEESPGADPPEEIETPLPQPQPEPPQAPPEPQPAQAQAVPNWQSWAKLDYEDHTGCGPDGDHQCYGNGLCEAHVCVCDVGWRGPYCSQLDLLPAKKAAFGIPMNGGHPTWGGSAVYDGSTWKLLTGSKIALEDHKNLDPYTFWGRDPEYDQSAAQKGEDPFHGKHPWKYTVDSSRSPFPHGGTEIDSGRDLYQKKAWLSLYESEGSDAAGPYRETVPKWFRTFRADLKKDPSSGAVFELSNANGGFTIIQSKSGSMAGPWLDKHGNAIDQAWAGASSDEPTETTRMPEPVYKFIDHGHCSKGWKSLGSLAGKYITRENGVYRECTVEEKDAWNCHVADPSFVVHQNGTTVIMYRGTRCESADGHTDHKERLGLLVASCWNCVYSKGAESIFKDDEVMNGGLEDLFMWIDSRGTHMVVHSQAQDHAYDPSLARATFHHKKKRGAYLFSADGKERWSLSNWELFPSEIRWDDGTTQLLLKQQRPSIIFDPHTGRPSHLVTGVDFLFDACCDWYAYGSGWTLVQPISTCPAGQILDGSGPSCISCDPAEAAYAGRCAKATSEYGSCVCGECKDGYSGDKCEIEPEPVYETVCEEFETSQECKNMDGEKKWLGKVDVETCRADCQAYAESEGLDGCCYHFTDPTNQNCRFFAGQASITTDKVEKATSACTRRKVE